MPNETVVARSWFERPLVTLDSPRALAAIAAAQGKGGLWVAGSYSLPGVPLLENACRSGLLAAEGIAAAHNLGLQRPWGTAETDRSQAMYTAGHCVLGTAAALQEGSWLALGFFPLLLALGAACLSFLGYALMAAALGGCWEKAAALQQ